jgi:thiol-disulfide isomerase/thioredoxin
MGEVSDLNERTARPRRWRIVVSAALTALALAACSRQPGASNAGVDSAAVKELARFASGPLKELIPSATRPMEPGTRFFDGQGQAAELKRFRGKVVVLNFWGTWCTPCVTEMPTLAALQTRYAGTDLVVVPISEPMTSGPGALKDVKNFMDVHPPLPIYLDKDLAMERELKIKGLPATVIYDRQGREVARVTGQVTWDSPEAIALIDHLLKEK